MIKTKTFNVIPIGYANEISILDNATSQQNCPKKIETTPIKNNGNFNRFIKYAIKSTHVSKGMGPSMFNFDLTATAPNEFIIIDKTIIPQVTKIKLISTPHLNNFQNHIKDKHPKSKTLEGEFINSNVMIIIDV